MRTIPLDGTWSLGVLIGAPICALILLAILAFAGFALYEREIGIGLGAVAGALVWLLIVISPIGFWPLKAEYHQWRDVSGTVSQIDKRLIGSGDKMEDKFVVRFTTGDNQYGCDDTRCAQVREGDRLTLSCKRAWQYTGTNGYDCRFVSTEAGR